MGADNIHWLDEGVLGFQWKNLDFTVEVVNGEIKWDTLDCLVEIIKQVDFPEYHLVRRDLAEFLSNSV